MKMVRLLAAAAFVLAMTPAVAASATTSATDEISFDGYCDGMMMSFPSAGTGVAGTVDGTQTGCVANALFGQSRGTSFSDGRTYITDAPDSLMYIIRANKTWDLYALNGTELVVINSGTWSAGPPPQTGVASSSVRTQADPSAGTLGRRIKEISLDGYCDGMHFNIPSAGTAGKHTIDGMRTGCAGPDGLMGEHARIATAENKGNVVSFFADGAVWIQAGVFKDHTWVFYGTDGTNLYVLNSGTWTEGPPAANAAALKPSI